MPLYHNPRFHRFVGRSMLTVGICSNAMHFLFWTHVTYSLLFQLTVEASGLDHNMSPLDSVAPRDDNLPRSLLQTGEVEASVTLCDKINSLFDDSKACRCEMPMHGGAGTVASVDRAGGSWETANSWIGCTRVGMPEVFGALSVLPNDTAFHKLWIWDTVIPIVPARLFQNVQAEQLILESSYTGDFTPGALEGMGDTLRHLELRNNAFRDIRADMFNGLGKLEWLDISGNSISELRENSLGDDLANLESLSLYKNKVTRIGSGAFRRLSKLKQLNLAANELTVIENDTFAGLEQLDTLNLGENRISSVEPGAFEHLRNLRVLHLGHNKLSELRLENLPKLEKVFIENNQISSLSSVVLEALPLLRNINLDKNRIPEISEKHSITHLPGLKIFSITNNAISQISPHALEGLESLETLSLQQNALTVLPDNVFQNQRNLKHLFLSQNRLEMLDEQSLAGLQRAKVISFGHNALNFVHRRAFSHLFELQKLYLNDNELQTLENSTLAYLETNVAGVVDLSDNPWYCTCHISWLSDWIATHKERVLNPDRLVCAKPRPGPLVETLEELKGPCSINGASPPTFTGTKNAWITILGILLGTLSIIVLCAIGVLYLRDQKSSMRIYHASASSLRRVPSDKVDLMPKRPTKVRFKE